MPFEDVGTASDRRTLSRKMVYQSAFNKPVKESKVETAEDRDERHKVSGAHSSKQSPQDAFDERQRARPSAGTWGVSVSDVDRAGSRLIDDSACPTPEGISGPRGATFFSPARCLRP
jgi:hypothetical protein